MKHNGNPLGTFLGVLLVGFAYMYIKVVVPVGDWIERKVFGR